MRCVNEVVFLAFVILFMCLPVAFAGTVGFFSQDWTSQAYYIISPGALDVVGQIAYFGSHYTGPPLTNFLYAVNITTGDTIWRYNTGLPINYVSNFTYNNSTYIIAGTGDPTILPTYGGYVLARTQENGTWWNSTNLGSSVQSLGAVGSGVENGEDVMAGLANGQVVRLSGGNGSIEWRYSCAGNITANIVPNIVQLDNGSVAVGTSNVNTGQSYIYSFKKNGTLAWDYPLKINIQLHLIKRLGNLNEVVVAFGDTIDVRNGTTGAEIWSQPFNTTQHVAPYTVTQLVTDLLCTEDYTGDGFPDIVAGTDGGFLMIINGQNGTLFKESTQISYTLSYIQYMYSYETGVPLLNKTLAVSIETSSYSYYIYGVNASDLTVENKFPVPESFATANLVSTPNSTSYTGDLLFSAYNVVYFISGTEIIVSEFPSQIMLVIVILASLISIMISKRHKSRIK
ncbi:MAG TPA: PQQ-binding-like beta-propeller repeat protein [Candidatus Bathyarchaeia archaeon]|nr:PQQ-binding-like beta-propeller repeat protein [Candidatus Bathyarchaeia archaeon]